MKWHVFVFTEKQTKVKVSGALTKLYLPDKTIHKGLFNNITRIQIVKLKLL